MLKYAFLFIMGIFVVNTAFCKTADTSMVFLRVFGEYTIKVMSLYEADYYRLILPPDSGDNRYNIKEYYKGGKLKLVGKLYSAASFRDRTSATATYDGECISYFPNGVKSSVSHYKNGNKDGIEYLFYPNGKPYCSMKYVQEKSTMYYWEWYDADGNELCKDGKGKWVTYFDDYKTIKLEGQVADGEMDGEWHFITFKPDTIKYTSKYKKGFLISSIGYDKHGNAFPFQNQQERASYRSGQITFLEVLRSHIKIPKDINGKKMLMDTAHVSFIIEKDGRLDDFSILGNVDDKIKEAVFSGLGKCHGWNPERYFGVPFRTQIVFPLSEISGYTASGSYRKELIYRERILKGD
jgi:antitoxin component YwqK of YwqJK toxin-antitoxin module